MANKIKKWCLLEDGTIERCYYRNGNMRDFEKRGKDWYLIHDVYAHQMIITMCHKVIKFADTTEELINVRR